MEGLWVGESEDCLFDGDLVRGCRRIERAIYPPEVVNACPKDEKKLDMKKEKEEIRVLFVDIALMESKKHTNDATCIGLMQLFPNNSKSDYIRTISYMETYPGIHAEKLSLRIRSLYDDLDCDYIVMDANGQGQPIFDVLAGNPIIDPVSRKEYQPLDCMNNEELSSRCLMPNNPKVIYAVKAYSKGNNDMIIYLKNAINSNKMRLLIDENEAVQRRLQNLSGWDDYSPELKSKLQQPYIQTTFAIQEMLNLIGKRMKDGNIAVEAPGRSRKDRFSAIAMGNMFATELARTNFRKRGQIDLEDDDDPFIGFFTV